MRTGSATSAVLLLSVAGGCGRTAADAARLRAVPFQQVEITDEFWSRRIEVNRRVTVLACLDQCERTGRIQNLAVAGRLAAGSFVGRRYNDSDVYKVIEGAAYALHDRRDAALEERVDAIVDCIAAAQQPDGYVNSYYTIVKPQERFQDTAHGHELYSAGHLIEAGIAYFRATGKRRLLEVAIRFADLIDEEFGPDGRLDPPGHQELELALFKLAGMTGVPRYARLARFFLEQRGSRQRERLYGEYSQDHLPVRAQTEPVGHAVRAMYQYCAMADLVARTGDPGMRAALHAIWDNLTEGKMYVTGGIGANASNEGFTDAFRLPNDNAYAETCAAIGLALWSHRMFLLDGESEHVDVLERALYNGLLSGVSLSGDRFFYTNPLASRGKDDRRPWFTTACCPTNIVRYLPALGERIWARGGNTIYVLLFVASKARIELAGTGVDVELDGAFPRREEIGLTVNPDRPAEFELAIRVPGWCTEFPSLAVNGGPGRAVAPADGFVRLEREWHRGDRVQLGLPLRARRVYPDPRVASNAGRVAIQRGPFVYCFEGVDHGGHARNLVLPEDAGLELASDPELGLPRVEANGLRVVEMDGKRVTEPVRLSALPYFAWQNRGPGEMVVWIASSPELAELPGETPFELVDGIKVRASHCWRGDTVRALCDRKLPRSSDDHSIPRMTWWSRKGSTEWIEYEFPQARRLDRTEIYWFDDSTRGGGCRTPRSWRLLFKVGDSWQPVRAASFPVEKDRLHLVEFEPVTTTAVRVEVELRPGFSGGVLEWRIGSE